MPEKIYDEIPTLDLHDFINGNASGKRSFITNLGEAYQNIGFVAVNNHGFTDAKREQLYKVIQRFFALPDKVKQQYEFRELSGQRGYIGKGKEHAKGRSTGDLTRKIHSRQ